MDHSQLIRQSIPEYDSMHPIQQELLEKYFNYRVLFDLQDRFKIKQKNIERLQRQDIASVRATTPGGYRKHVCKFGHACFRKNPEHLEEYLHYSKAVKNRIDRYMIDIELLESHQQHHLNKLQTQGQSHNQVENKIATAKQFADFVLTQYNTLETDRFMQLLQLLAQFEQPINPELDNQDYGLECPGFAIIMTWIMNIHDTKYRKKSLAIFFSLLDQIPVSGSYNKETIQKEIPPVNSAYRDNIYPEQGRYIRDDPLISNNTMADYLDNLSDDDTNTKRQRRDNLAGIIKKITATKRLKSKRLKSKRLKSKRRKSKKKSK